MFCQVEAIVIKAKCNGTNWGMYQIIAFSKLYTISVCYMVIGIMYIHVRNLFVLIDIAK